MTVSLTPFVLDGAFDSAGYLLATNGTTLYAAVRGTTLYVATRSPGNSGTNDYFIFVSDQLLGSATAAAPWAKSGHVAVAATKPFLATESLNSYVSWFVNNAATNWPCAKSATTTGALEGTLDLVGAFGYLPANIYLCAAAYQTADGGALTAQCPAGSGPDIDTNEFLVIPTVALHDFNADGQFDRLDPALDFRLLNTQAGSNGCALFWTSMPGRRYQVVYANSLGGVWSDLAGASNTAGPVQLLLNFTDAPPMMAGQRYYRIKLLP